MILMAETEAPESPREKPKEEEKPPFAYQVRWWVRIMWFILGALAGGLGGYFAKASAMGGCFSFVAFTLIAGLALSAYLFGYRSRGEVEKMIGDKKEAKTKEYDETFDRIFKG